MDHPRNAPNLPVPFNGAWRNEITRKSTVKCTLMNGKHVVTNMWHCIGRNSKNKNGEQHQQQLSSHQPRKSQPNLLYHHDGSNKGLVMRNNEPVALQYDGAKSMDVFGGGVLRKFLLLTCKETFEKEREFVVPIESSLIILLFAAKANLVNNQ
mmetsp:Transcript_14187/g.23495  ORF Transcript_14187/g.23495 Transcript_14187/m.23495 type:complete len:153 (-) Transcript_14187:25-483(-)